MRCARATVATRTEAAPAFFNTRLQARAVAPVVYTSSTSRICRPRTAPGRGEKKAPRRFCRRWWGRQARLTHRNAYPFQQTRIEVQFPLGMAAARLGDGRASQQLGMVEAAPALLAQVHRHRDHQHLPGHPSGGGKRLQALRQQNTQSPGHWLHTVVLEQMDERAKLAMVVAISHRLDEGRCS